MRTSEPIFFAIINHDGWSMDFATCEALHQPRVHHTQAEDAMQITLQGSFLRKRLSVHAGSNGQKAKSPTDSGL